MSLLPNLPVFPHTIGNLDDKPNLSADEMKEKFEHDTMTLWAKLREAIPVLNSKFDDAGVTKTVNHSSTDSKVPTAKAVYDAIVAALVGDDGSTAAQIITTWLGEHPEYVVNISDDSITDAKLKQSGDNILPRVASLMEAVVKYGDYPFSEAFLSRNTGSMSNVTFTWSGKTCTVTSSGASSSVAVNVMYYVDYETMPAGLEAGKLYYVKYDTSNPDVKLSIVFYKNNNNIDPDYYTYVGDGYMRVPADATGVSIRLYVNAGVTFSTPAVVKTIGILPSKPVRDVINPADGLTATTRVIRDVSAMNTINDLTDLPEYSYYVNSGSVLTGILGEDFTYSLAQTSSYCLFKFRSVTAANQYILMRLNGSETYVGYSLIADPDTVIWNNVGYSALVNETKQPIRILCIGNSYTQDSTVYSPYIMEKLSDRIAVTLGIAYYSGATIDNYISLYDNDTAVLSYNKKSPGSLAWATSSNKTIKQIIDDENWDMILFTQASMDAGNWSTFANLNTLINKVVGYHKAVNSSSVKLGWVMPQLRLAKIEEIPYADVIECVRRVLATTPIQFFIPVGTAIENARGTSLNNLGDSGGLTSDLSHLQEGVPVLLASYVSAMTFLSMAGLGFYGIMGDDTNPNDTWVSDRNIPGQNGDNAIAATNETALLAQKCAVAAVKNPFEITAL